MTPIGNEEPLIFNRVVFNHNASCTCDNCNNKRQLKSMKYIAFTEHRGYMEEPVTFDSYEEAVKYVKENNSFGGWYVVFGKLLSR